MGPETSEVFFNGNLDDFVRNRNFSIFVIPAMGRSPIPILLGKEPFFSQTLMSFDMVGLKVQGLNISCLSDLDIEAILRAVQTGIIITYEDIIFKPV
jgi:hypothetical protein